jgi:hypothetical protein
MSGLPGTVVSFYSYKGGVGRTMAVGNVAMTLARNGFRVLVVDLDLYAPGVQEYPPFHDAVKSSIRYVPPGDRELGQGGMLDLIERQLWSSASPEDAVRQPFREKLRPVDEKKEIWQKWMRRVHEHKASGGYVDVIPAGPADHRALETLAGIGWYGFLTKFDGFKFILSMRDQWWREYDFTLIDSRTGLSDYLQFCVGILPDVAVVVAGLNEENLKGLHVPLASVDEVRPSGDLHIIPVLSLIPSGDLDKLQERITKAEESLRVGKWAKMLLGEPVRLPYVSTLAVEERLVVPDHPHSSIFREYVRIAERLARHRFAEIDNLISLALYEGAVTGLEGQAVDILNRARAKSKDAKYMYGLIRCAKLDAQRLAYSEADIDETQRRFQTAVTLIRERHLKPGQQQWKDADSSVGHWQIELETLFFYARALAKSDDPRAIRAFIDTLEFMKALEKRNYTDMFSDRDWDRYAHELLFTRAFCQWGILQAQAKEMEKRTPVKSVLQASVETTYELFNQLMPTGIIPEVAVPLKLIKDAVELLP